MAQKLDVQYIRYYTPGSAAQKIMPAFPAEKSVLPRLKKRKVHKIYVDPVAMLGIAVAVCMLILMAVGVHQLRQAQRQTDTMQSYVDQLSKSNAQLRERYTESYDIREVEEVALAMGMIPQEEADRIRVSVELPVQEEQQASLWQQLGTFLTGLFA